MTVDVRTLPATARIVAELRERLKAEYQLEDGDEALETTLDGASDLPELLAALARDVRRTEAHAEAVKAIMRENADRAMRLDAKAEKQRGMIAWAMAESGMKRIPDDALPEMTVTVREGKRPLIVMNEDLIPDSLCRVKTVRSPDRVALRNHLESGERLESAMLGNAMPVLSMRTR